MTPDQILKAIDAIPTREESERNYLGASVVGDPCAHKLWLQFHRYVEPEKFEPRMLRLFKRGNREEGFFQSYLESIGFEVIESCFSQARFTDGFFSGAGDGVLLKDGVRYVAEYKTHSLKSFEKLERGQLERDFPKHSSQIHINGHKLDCTKGIYLAVCKNDDRLFCDIIDIDPVKAKAIQDKAEFITMSDKPPERICSKPTVFGAKFCSAKDVCFGMEVPRVNCRNCTSGDKYREFGAFGCSKIGADYKSELMLANDPLPKSGSCEHHSWNPWAMNDLLGYQIIEFYPKERAVKYKKPDGDEIINGAAPFGVESKELKND